MLVNNNAKTLSTYVSSHVPNISPATKQKRHKAGLNIVKMKYIDLNKLRAATEAQISETKALFSNKFKLFIKCLIKEFQDVPW